MSEASLNIVLVGNPNAGKTSVFNALTGLRQKTGNFPGVTVDRFEGQLLIEGKKFLLSDLPGTYSLYPKSEDEKVVLNSLLGKYKDFVPDRLLLVLDASTLKRSLLLFSQVADLGIPMMVAVTMEDVAKEKNELLDVSYLEKHFKVPFVSVNPRTGLGIEKINKLIFNDDYKVVSTGFGLESIVTTDFLNDLKAEIQTSNDYEALLEAHMSAENPNDHKLDEVISKHKFISRNCQARETLQRYFLINDVVDRAIKQAEKNPKKTFSEKLDSVLTHKFYGYVVFLAILFVVFQSIFALASYPMAWIEQAISFAQQQLHPLLGGGVFADLVSEGVLSGIGGVLMFVPQIAFLFFFVSLLEESGYMARVMFIMDKLMRAFGMSGKSVIPLVSGVACAVPAIMSARTIDNKKERLITIFVTPLISCSARIPVFTIMIGLLIPPQTVFVFFNLQGFVLMGCYLTGFCAALFTAFLLKKRSFSKSKSFFILELPVFRSPSWKNVFTNIFHKVKTFVVDAGKIIVAISIVLWWLASFGPDEMQQKAEEKAAMIAQESDMDYETVLKAQKLENSYAGIVGKSIEPLIAPLGFDWKIGIALLTSFAAREVFVGTMATIYSVNADLENPETLTQRMRMEKKGQSNEPLFNSAVCLSLIVFYILAMQCMSTLAVTFRETKSIKWPAMQFVYMTGLAYVASMLVYQLMS